MKTRVIPAEIAALEPRCLLSVSITGTPAADTIELQAQSNGATWVWIDRPETQKPNYRLAASTGAITFDGGGGSDTVIFDNLLSVPVVTNLNGEIDLSDSQQDLTIASGNVVVDVGTFAGNAVDPLALHGASRSRRKINGR